jgi:hypothetical protein
MSATFRSDRAAVVKANRWLLAFALIFTGAAGVLGASGVSALPLLAVPAGALALAALLAMRERRWPRLVRTRIEADATGVRDQGKVLVRRQDIVHGFALPMADGCLVRLVLRGMRRPLDIAVWDADEGRDLLRALDLDASQTTAEIEGLSATFYLPTLARYGIALGWLVAVQQIFSMFIQAGSMPFALGILLLTALFAYSRWSASKVMVGIDGVHVRWLWWSRYVPFSRVQSVRPYSVGAVHGAELLLDDGSKQPILISRGTETEVANLAAARVHQAFEAYLARRGSADMSEALARRARSPSEWLTALRALGAGANAGMRTATVSHERLWEIVGDPSAPAARRAGAAVALASRGSEEDRSRVRIAAKGIAEPKLRFAVEKSADEAASDAELCEALGELEAGQEKNAGTPRDAKAPRQF